MVDRGQVTLNVRQAVCSPEEVVTTLRFRVADTTVPVPVLARLRQLTSLSISEIRSRAVAGEAIFEITPFQSDWQTRRTTLVQVAHEIADGSLPLKITELHADRESAVSLQMLKNLIEQFRQIEVESQKDTMLELGEISDPAEFIPYDEDWTQ